MGGVCHFKKENGPRTLGLYFRVALQHVTEAGTCCVIRSQGEGRAPAFRMLDSPHPVSLTICNATRKYVSPSCTDW